jgi:uncharacterized protein YhbP (UPF0306 family)
MGTEDLRERVAAYLASHHTMTLATFGPGPESTAGGPNGRPTGASEPGAAGGAPPGIASSATTLLIPHAASVFYVVDRALRLVFISKPASLHGRHIGDEGPVAVTVSEDYGDWEAIQGVQLWGEARLLSGASRATAMTLYLTRFPFVRDMMKQPKLAELIAGIGVYRIEPRRVGFTDNTTGVFGREVLDLGES